MVQLFYKIKGAERHHLQWDTLITIKNHQIGPQHWKTFKNNKNNQGYA